MGEIAAHCAESRCSVLPAGSNNKSLAPLDPGLTLATHCETKSFDSQA